MPPTGWRKPLGKTKRCPTCKRVLPRTSDFFHRHATKADGLSAICKACRNEWLREYKRTAKHAEWKRRSAKKIRRYQHRYNVSEKGKAKRERYRQKARATKPEHQKALDFLRAEMEKGHAIRPRKCQERGCTRRSTWVYLKQTSPAIVFVCLCPKHHAKARREAHALRELFIDRREWVALHRAHREAIEAERAYFEKRRAEAEALPDGPEKALERRRIFLEDFFYDIPEPERTVRVKAELRRKTSQAGSVEGV